MTLLFTLAFSLQTSALLAQATVYGYDSSPTFVAPAGTIVQFQLTRAISAYPIFGYRQTFNVIVGSNGYWVQTNVLAGAYNVIAGPSSDTVQIYVPPMTNAFNFLDLQAPPYLLPGVPLGLPLDLLAADGATIGDLMVFNGTNWAPDLSGTNSFDPAIFHKNSAGQITSSGSPSLVNGLTNLGPTVLEAPTTNLLWPLWQTNTAYLQGNIVMNTNLQLWQAWQAGTSGSTMPFGSQSVTDSTVIWYPYGSPIASTVPVNPPSIYTLYQNQAFAATGNLQYFPYSGSTGGASNYLAGLNYFNIEGGVPFKTAGWFTASQVQVDSSAFEPYEAGYVTHTNFGFVASWAGIPKVTFMSDAPLIGIGPYGTSHGYNGNLGNVFVDDERVSAQSWDVPALNGTNQNFIMLDFHGVRKARRIAFYPAFGLAFPGVMVDHSSHIWAAPTNYTIYIEGCSYEAGGNYAPYQYGSLWPQILARKLRCYNMIDGGVGGSGFTNFQGRYIYQMPASNAVADNYCGRAPMIISNNPDLVLVDIGPNDANTQAGSSNTIYQSNLVWLTTVRAGLPAVPIVEIALLPGPPEMGTPYTTAVAACSNAVLAFNDTNVFFVNGLPWFSGTGNVAATNGTGNSDFYISSDGVHPTDYGAEYIAQNVATALQTIFGAPDAMAQKFNHGTYPSVTIQTGDLNLDASGAINVNHLPFWQWNYSQTNYFWGQYAGNQTNTSYNMLGIGWGTLFHDSASHDDIAIGYNVLVQNLTGHNNTVVGSAAMSANTTGNDNTALGAGALIHNTTAQLNTAIGYSSMYGNDVGINNTGLGACTLTNCTGNWNIGIGLFGGANLTTGQYDIDIGHGGVAGESFITRLGSNQTDAYIAGNIWPSGGVTVTNGGITNTGAGPMVAGTGGITLGGVNQTSWPGGGGSQTPITANVNGAGYTGSNWGTLQATNVTASAATITNALTNLAATASTIAVWNAGKGLVSGALDNTLSLTTGTLSAGPMGTTISNVFATLTGLAAQGTASSNTFQWGAATLSNLVAAVTINATGQWTNSPWCPFTNTFSSLTILSNGITWTATNGASIILTNGSALYSGPLYGSNGVQVLYLPNTTIWTNNLFVGNGGANLNVNATGNGDPLNGTYAGAYASEWNTCVGMGAGNALTCGNQNTIVGTYGVASGYAPLSNGTQNAFFGDEAGGSMGSALHNTCIGAWAGFGNVSGYGNVWVGTDAGLEGGTTVSNHTAVGQGAGASNAVNGNCFMGFASGNWSSTGAQLAFYGYCTGYSNTTGSGNTYMGDNSGGMNQTGNYNTSVGGSSLGVNTVSDNTAVGFDALEKDTSGHDNTAVGYVALQLLVSGSDNVAIGSYTLDTTTGNYNTGVGYNAMGPLTTGNYNIGLGYKAGTNLTTGTNNIEIWSGANTPSLGNENNTTRLGYSQTNAIIAGNVGSTNTAMWGPLYLSATGYTNTNNFWVTVCYTNGFTNLFKSNAVPALVYGPTTNAWSTEITLGLGCTVTNNTTHFVVTPFGQ